MANTIFHPKEKLRERSSTYFLEDRSKLEEITRLEIQDKMLTLCMGGVLPELADPTLLRRVLDVGCGTGGWLIETAKRYPTIKRLEGVDLSTTMVAHAQREATTALLDERVRFQVMDALGILDFPTSCFDLVNQRLGVSWLRTWEWRKVLWEYYRVTRPGGVIRITEANVLVESNSPALTQINMIILQAFAHSGRLFTACSDGVTGELVHLMKEHGLQDVQTRLHTLTYRAGTVEGRYFYEDIQHLFRVALPFFQKWTHVPNDYQEIYQQALKEMQQPDFVATWTLLTAWGNKPRYYAPD